MKTRLENTGLSRRDLLLGSGSQIGPKRTEPSILVHEHVLVDFAGAGIASPSRYNADEAFSKVKPLLDTIVAAGCVRLLECTPNFLGRDPRLLARLSQATGLEIWTNTGLYAANTYRHLPPFVREETALALSKRWTSEHRQGIDGVKPRFIKIGVNGGPLGELDRKLVEAAAIASLETGLTIASHSGPRSVLEQLDILSKAKLNMAKFVWVHAQNERDHAVHGHVARAGAWVEFDGVNAKSAAWHKQCIEFMAGENLLGQVLISQDSGWYRVGEAGGGVINGYDFIYRDFLPQLKAEWRTPLMWTNPRAAFGSA